MKKRTFKKPFLLVLVVFVTALVLLWSSILRSKPSGVASRDPGLPSSPRWETYKNEQFLNAFSVGFEFPDSWEKFYGESYLLLYAGRPPKMENESLNDSDGLEGEVEAWLQVWLKDSSLLSPEDWINQGRSLYRCIDPEWFQISGKSAVKCAPVLVREADGEFAETQVYSFSSPRSLLSFLMAVNNGISPASQEIYLRGFEHILSTFRLF